MRRPRGALARSMPSPRRSRTRCRRCSAAAGSSMPAPARPGGSACRTAPSCRRPTTGRSTAWSSPWRAGSARWCRAPRAPRTTRPPARAPSRANKIGANDVVIGIAASGTTPFTIGVLRAASAAGAVTIAVANNPDAPLFEVARHRILVDTGTEVIAGSTRMKAGTAQKIVLNLFSTAVMVQARPRLSRADGAHAGAATPSCAAAPSAWWRRSSAAPARDAARYVEQADGDVKMAVLLGFGMKRERSRRGCWSGTAAICAPRSTNFAARMADRSRQTAMAREIAEIPAARRAACSRRATPFAAIAKRIDAGQAAHRRVVRARQLRPCRRVSALSARGAAWPAGLRRRAFRRDGLPASGRTCAMRCSSWCRSPGAAPISSWRRRWRASPAR